MMLILCFLSFNITKWQTFCNFLHSAISYIYFLLFCSLKAFFLCERMRGKIITTKRNQFLFCFAASVNIQKKTLKFTSHAIVDDFCMYNTGKLGHYHYKNNTASSVFLLNTQNVYFQIMNFCKL